MNGAKLYNVLKEKVAEMKGVRRAWFTTFNLDIQFFEQFILPVVLDMDFPGTKAEKLNHYEDMNDELADDSIDGTEVRIFYDYRALNADRVIKNTTLKLHPVNPADFTEYQNTQFYSQGVFHPKVAIFEGKNGTYYLLTGSANITVSAWASNRECFYFEEINDKDNAKRIGDFFARLALSQTEIGNYENHPLLKKLKHGKNWGENNKWKFASSFDIKNLPSELKDSGTELKIWSPYWTKDLEDFTEQLKREQNFEQVILIPSKNNGKIAITEEVFESCKSKKIKFKEELFDDEEVFVHAKVWLTQRKIAIGSWNATRSGTNYQKSEKRNDNINNNIEAGVIIKITPKEKAAIDKMSKFKDLNKANHFTENEMQDEKQSMLAKYSFPFEITLDWKEGTIQLTRPSKMPEDFENKLDVYFGTDSKQKIESIQKPFSIKNDLLAFLFRRNFVIKKKEEIIFRGYFNEIGLSDRQPNCFEDEFDLLYNYIEESPDKVKDLHVRNLPEGEEETGGSKEDNKREVQPWFIALQGFGRIRAKLEEIKKTKKSERIDSLRKIGRVNVGSIMELINKMEKRRSKIESQIPNEMNGVVFTWFMIEETNRCRKIYNEMIKDVNVSQTELLPEIKNYNLKDKISAAGITYDGIDINQLPEFLKLINTHLRTGL
jgi:hypothetical protein